MNADDYLKMFYKYLMEKYGWSPQKIDTEDFFYIQDLEFGDWNEESASEPVIQYADDLPF